jgi:hypothetical protein
MVEPNEEEEEFSFDDAIDQKEQLDKKNALDGIKVRQSCFKGKNGPLSVMKREKDLSGEGNEEAFVRGETTAASALELAKADESLAKYIKQLGIKDLEDGAAENVESKGNPEETFVEFVKLEMVSP